MDGQELEIVVPIERDADIFVAQRRARLFAESVGFDLIAQYEIAIAVSEAASNIVKYAAPGHIHLRFAPDEFFLELEAVDHGAGIADVRLAMRDGVSEGRDQAVDVDALKRRGLGLGFGVIGRCMQDLQVFSSSEGTRLVARKSHRDNSQKTSGQGSR